MHTLTDDSSIFRVCTVMNTKWVTATVHKSGLSPSTGHIVQKNGSSSPTKESTRPGNCTCREQIYSQTHRVVKNTQKIISLVETHKSLVVYVIRKHSCVSTRVSINSNYMNQHRKYAIAHVPIGENPSCLHATRASKVLHESSHTVPHALLLQISTRPL